MSNSDCVSVYTDDDADDAQGGFNGRPLVQWPTRPLGRWALQAPGPQGPWKAKFGLAVAKS